MSVSNESLGDSILETSSESIENRFASLDNDPGLSEVSAQPSDK